MRQLQEIVASKSSSRETEHRAGDTPSEACSSIGIAGMDSGGQSTGKEMEKSASLHIDMQRLIAEVRETTDGSEGVSECAMVLACEVLHR